MTKNAALSEYVAKMKKFRVAEKRIVELESDFVLAEQSINDLTAACRKQAGQIADLLDALKDLADGLAVHHPESAHDWKAYHTARAALEAAEGKQVTL